MSAFCVKMSWYRASQRDIRVSCFNYRSPSCGVIDSFKNQNIARHFAENWFVTSYAWFLTNKLVFYTLYSSLGYRTLSNLGIAVKHNIYSHMLVETWHANIMLAATRSLTHVLRLPTFFRHNFQFSLIMFGKNWDSLNGKVLRMWSSCSIVSMSIGR